MQFISVKIFNLRMGILQCGHLLIKHQNAWPYMPLVFRQISHPANGDSFY